jgi:hypothetical protein
MALPRHSLAALGCSNASISPHTQPPPESRKRSAGPPRSGRFIGTPSQADRQRARENAQVPSSPGQRAGGAAMAARRSPRAGGAGQGVRGWEASRRKVFLELWSGLMTDTWNKRLSASRGALIHSDQVLLGNSHGNPCLGTKECSEGKSEWRIRCDGSHRIVIGVARPVASLHKLMWSSEDCWGIALDDRDMDFAKKFTERASGPVSFKVPCEVTLILDSDLGTLSMTAAGIDFGPLCTTLPRKEALHLAISTRDHHCKLTMLPPLKQKPIRRGIAKPQVIAGLTRKRTAQTTRQLSLRPKRQKLVQRATSF